MAAWCMQYYDGLLVVGNNYLVFIGNHSYDLNTNGNWTEIVYKYLR